MMVLSVPAKGAPEIASWIDEYDSQNKDKNITIAKNKSVTFPCSVS